MKKYFLIFTFLFLIPTVSLAEKKNNKLTLSENEWKKLLDESYFMGMYDGHVMNACAVYLLGKIDKELKIDLIELPRKKLYENASKPKEYELGTMELTNDKLRFIKNEPCFSEID